jgi:hypothetical protein
MDNILLEHIVKHVFSNLVVIPSNFVNTKTSESLTNKKYLLNEKLSFETEDGRFIENKIWGCQFMADQQELNILLGDCSQDPNIPEFALVVQLKNAPIYGLYLVYNNLIDDKIDSEALIAYSLNEKDWLICSTYLQATFLSGMEQIRELGLPWQKITNYKTQYDMLLSFINYHNSYFEEQNEGQEDRL